MRCLCSQRDIEGMICDVLFLYARDSEQIKDDLLQQLRGVFAHCVCIDDPELSCEEALKNFTQVKLQVVFFSPGFLQFLECRGVEAYDYFCHLDPQSTVALFCCGLLERMIFCYHTAPLKSYSSWPKYEHVAGQKDASAFSPYFLGLFQEFLPDQNRTQEGVMIIPQLINKESSTVYVVFSEAMENFEEFTVHLEAGSKIQVAPECINEYMLYFKIPDTILDNCKSIDVGIKQSGKFIAVSDLTVVSPTDNNECQNTTENNMEIIKLRNKEVEDAMYDNYRSSQESLGTISHQHASRDSPDIRKKYEERNSMSDNTDLSEEINRPYFMRASSNEQVNYFEDIDDTYPAIYRSVSLPSIIPQQETCCNHDPIYLPMIPIYHHNNQNIYCQSTSNPSLHESSSYVYMSFHGNAQPERDFGGSQQVMQTFKKETKDKGTRSRRKKHVESPNSSGNEERPSTFGERKLKRGSKRSTLTTDSDSRMSSKRNSYNDSASSSSSKGSEVSNCTVQSWKFSDSPTVTDETYTNTFPNYQAARASTLSNESKPQLRNEDSSLYRTRYANKNNKPNATVNPVNQIPKRDTEDEKVESLIKVCQRYGLQHLGDYFISGCPDNVDFLKNYNVQETGERNAFNIERFEISGEWDQDTIPSLQRSFSLPSTLFPTEPVIHLGDNLDDGYDDVRYPDDQIESLTCGCEGYINALPSGIYMSLVQDKNRDGTQNSGCPVDTCKSINDLCSYSSGIYMSLIPVESNDNVQNCAPSNSQEELLELMDAYKRGDKTISQVEQQFQQWHCRHMGATSNREKQLLHLRDQYERAQKQNKPRLIQFFPLRKPKPGRKEKKTSDENHRAEKKKVGKANSDTKRLSKDSAASNSSGGTSDNSDIFKWCYDNPGYIGTQKVRRGNNFKPFCSPPPLPPRPPLTPISIMRTLVFDQKSQSSEDEKTPPTKSESPQIGKKKPSPPPKPPDVFQKLRCDRPRDSNVDQPSKQIEQASENEEIRAESPDGEYIDPKVVRRIPSRKKRNVVRPNPTCPLHCPIPGLHFHAKLPHDPASCPATLLNSRNNNKDSPKRLSWNLLFKEALPNPFAGFATSLAKSKKVEMSKFYVARKWSSFPRLDSTQIHTYLELQDDLELQDLCGNRNRSISNNSNHVN